MPKVITSSNLYKHTQQQFIFIVAVSLFNRGVLRHGQKKQEGILVATIGFAEHLVRSIDGKSELFNIPFVEKGLQSPTVGDRVELLYDEFDPRPIDIQRIGTPPSFAEAFNLLAGQKNIEDLSALFKRTAEEHVKKHPCLACDPVSDEDALDPLELAEWVTNVYNPLHTQVSHIEDNPYLRLHGWLALIHLLEDKCVSSQQRVEIFCKRPEPAEVNSSPEVASFYWEIRTSLDKELVDEAAATLEILADLQSSNADLLVGVGQKICAAEIPFITRALEAMPDKMSRSYATEIGGLLRKHAPVRVKTAYTPSAG